MSKSNLHEIVSLFFGKRDKSLNSRAEDDLRGPPGLAAPIGDLGYVARLESDIFLKDGFLAAFFSITSSGDVVLKCRINWSTLPSTQTIGRSMSELDILVLSFPSITGYNSVSFGSPKPRSLK
jgi:hypothetical protein